MYHNGIAPSSVVILSVHPGPAEAGPTRMHGVNSSTLCLHGNRARVR